MFRTVANNVWAFDLEWVPDPLSGRRAYDLPADTPDADVLEVMWSHARTLSLIHISEPTRPY